MWIKRSSMIFVVLILIFSMLMLRLYYVSFGGIADEVKSVAGKRSAELVIYNSKGVIYDRNLCALAGNQFSYYLVIDPREFDRNQIEYLSHIANIDSKVLSEKLSKETPFVLQSFYEPETISGVTVFEGTARYPENAIAQHLVGYLDSDGNIGVSGVEKAYNDELTVYLKEFSVSYLTDAVHGIISGLNVFKGENSDDTKDGMILTIDKNLSVIAEESMKEHIDSGCVIVMDSSNGEILVMSSTPGFDSYNITEYIDSDNGELINNAMVNQTVGSVFKIIVAAAALQLGYEDFTFECNGGITVGGRVFSCQNNREHGELDLKDAFSKSCNSFFIALGQLVGYDNIIETAQLFGVDSSIRVCKNMIATAGILPQNEGVQSVANLSIGQGKLMMSPLAVSRITAAVCNGGFLVNPTVYLGEYHDGSVVNESSYSYKSKIMSSDISKKLVDMCVLCVEQGTGSNAMPLFVGAGGKTASAQTGKVGDDGDEILNTYFTGFFPAENPKYVITVFAADGVSGSETCAPVFKEICDFIYQNY